MTFVTVKDGTGAGRLMHRRHVPAQPWTCPKGHGNQGWHATCMAAGCRERRPT